MARERQVVVTLSFRVWAEFMRRREAALAAGASERGIDSAVINDWLTECMLRSGSGDGAALPPPTPPAGDGEDGDYGFDASKL